MGRSQIQGPSGLQTEFKASVGFSGDPVPVLKMKRFQGMKSAVELLFGIHKTPGSIPTTTKPERGDKQFYSIKFEKEVGKLLSIEQTPNDNSISQQNYIVRESEGNP